MASSVLCRNTNHLQKLHRSRKSCIITCSASSSRPNDGERLNSTRRLMLGACVAAFTGCEHHEAQAVTSNPLEFKKQIAKRRRKIPASEFTEGEQGLKYYDLEVGKGAMAVVGSRVAVHYDVKWRGITFMTSRQGMGVTGGTPLGFDVGTVAGTAGSTLPGLDLGVRGMRVGGLRRMIVPPNLAYGNRGIGEIPPGADLDVDLELLSVKDSAFGYQVKLVEG